MRTETAFGRLSILIFALIISASVRGATLYVSTQGNDSNPGSSAQPFRTITHAYSLASAGTTIIVLPGVYNDYTSGWGIHLGANGTAGNPITLRSQTPGAAVIDGQNASDRNVGLYIDGSYNIVDGFEIRNGPKGGITIWANNNQIRNCNVHHNGNPPSTSTHGMDGIYSSEGTSGNIYSANYIHHNGRVGSSLDHGLYLCGQNELIINNIVLANVGNGIQVAGYTTVSNMRIYNNVIAYNGANAIILWQTLNGVDIKNNILYANGHYAIGSYAAVGSGVNVDHNLSFGNGYGHFSFKDGGSTFTYTLGSAIYADPVLADSTATSFDPHLRAGSPAIQSGLNLFSALTTDFAGILRPASGSWDLGVYNYASAAASAQTVSVLASVPTTSIGTTNYGAFTFQRSGNTQSALTVNYSLGGTAVKWNDYYSVDGGDMPVSITIPAGSASYTMRIAARANQTGANPEYVSLTLSSDPSYQIGAPSNAVINIVSSPAATQSPVSLAIRKDPGGMALSWNSVVGKSYRVAYKPDLKASWTDLSATITATGSSTSWTDANSGAARQRFYTVYSIN